MTARFLERRVEDQRMRKVVYLPHYGEFGFLIMKHLRAVHNDQADVKIVCCERGNECLFPSATGSRTDCSGPCWDG